MSIPVAETQMIIPTPEQCLALMDKHSMLDNIRAHSLVVADVADVLVNGLENSDQLNDCPLPDRTLVRSGALLHDIAKTQCLENRCDHAHLGSEICRELGYPEIAEIVAEHVILSDFSTTRLRTGCILAKEIVYYADKRVRHDEIVSLDDRLDYILTHYGNNDPVLHELIRANFNHCLDFEEILFTFLPFTPDRVNNLVTEGPGQTDMSTD
ncbi:MAG: HDIG domain-containing metalloprotein [Thermodesulfobacteriota bacterium]